MPNVLDLSFNPILVGAHHWIFLSNSARRNFVAMKLLDCLRLPIVQLLRKFHSNILTNEGEGDNGD